MSSETQTVALLAFWSRTLLAESGDQESKLLDKCNRDTQDKDMKAIGVVHIQIWHHTHITLVPELSSLFSVTLVGLLGGIAPDADLLSALVISCLALSTADTTLWE